MWPWLTSCLPVLIIHTTICFLVFWGLMDSFDLSKLGNLSVTEEKTVVVPDGVWQSDVIDVECCLVGRILSRKPINIEAFERTMSGAWELTGGMQIQKLNETELLFKFEYALEKQRVMWRSPWSFDRNLVILRSIKKGQGIGEVDLNQCNFWVQVHDLPFAGMNRAMAKLIGDTVGTFVRLDIDEKNPRTIMRIRVLLDITKPLPRFMNMEGPRCNLCVSLLRMKSSLTSAITAGF